MLAIPTEKGDIVALAVHDGNVLWQLGRKKGAWSAEVWGIDDQKVYCNSGQYIMALSKHTGEEIWCTKVAGWPPAPGVPAMLIGDWLGISNMVFSIKDGRKSVNYDTEECCLVQEVAFNSDVWCRSFNIVKKGQPTLLLKYPMGGQSPTVSLDVSGHLSGFVQSSGLLVHSVTEAIADQEPTGRLVVRDADTGKQIRSISTQITSQPAVAGSRLFVMHVAKHRTKQLPSPRTLAAYDLNTGERLWECEEFLREPDSDSVHWAKTAPIVAGKYVWHSYGEKTAQGKLTDVLLAVDMDTGVPVWRTTLAGNRLGHLVATEERVIHVREGEVSCFMSQDATNKAEETSRNNSAEASRIHSDQPGTRANKKAARRRAGGGRKPIRYNKEGFYDINSGRTLVVSPAKKPRTLRMREADGKEGELFVLPTPGTWIEDIDVHAEAGTAVLKPCAAEGSRQEVYVFDGSIVHPLGIDKDHLNCISVAISPEGGRVACTFTFPDEPGDAQIRVFEISTQREVARIVLEDETILAADLSWQTNDLLRFANVNPGHDTEGCQFEANLQTCAVKKA